MALLSALLSTRRSSGQEAAEKAEQEAEEHARTVKELAGKIQSLLGNTNGKKNEIKKEVEALETKMTEFTQKEKAVWDRSKSEQAEGDGIYWAIYNLDRKNPNAKDDFEHLPPEQLADDILKK